MDCEHAVGSNEHYFAILVALLIVLLLILFWRVITDSSSSQVEKSAQKVPVVNSSIKPFFMPYEAQNCIKNLYQDLKSAKEKICIASYWITHSKIIFALKNARKRNVAVEIIFDKSTPGITILKQEFRSSGINFTESNVDSALMHQKFIIIDNTITWIGSANLTLTAFNQNYENMVRIESSEIACRYIEDFKRLINELGESRLRAGQNAF